jgi:hypothetical protein
MPQDSCVPDENQSLPDQTARDGAQLPMTASPAAPRILPRALPPDAAPCDALQSATARFAADMAAPTRFGADKFDVEARLIELGATLVAAQKLFQMLEHDFYRAAFGRYDE